MSDLDKRLLAAHATGDGRALVKLYMEAADAANDATATAFYLTHAHVYALETGDPAAFELRQRLEKMGREEPLPSPNPPIR